jgi:hypothetical protein
VSAIGNTVNGKAIGNAVKLQALILFHFSDIQGVIVHDRLEKIKTHLEEHKEAYIVGGFGIIAVVITAIGVRRLSSPGMVVNAANNTLTLADRVTVNNFDAVKRLSYIVRLKDTDLYWEAQADVAKALGYSEKAISHHLNRGKPLPGGEELVRVGVKSA